MCSLNSNTLEFQISMLEPLKDSRSPIKILVLELILKANKSRMITVCLKVNQWPGKQEHLLQILQLKLRLPLVQGNIDCQQILGITLILSVYNHDKFISY